eukprot:6895978-Prymnesium_polylepis.2
MYVMRLFAVRWGIIAAGTAQPQANNYIGPGWCGGSWSVPEGPQCDFSVPSKGCVDECVRGHDMFCASGYNVNCDKEMIACMERCPPGPTGALMKLKVTFLPGLCCGSPCSGGQQNAASSLGHSPHGHSPHGHQPHGHYPSRSVGCNCSPVSGVAAAARARVS